MCDDTNFKENMYFFKITVANYTKMVYNIENQQYTLRKFIFYEKIYLCR